MLRFLQGFLGSPCLVSGGASIGDMYSLISLPYAMMAWVAAAYCVSKSNHPSKVSFPRSVPSVLRVRYSCPWSILQRLLGPSKVLALVSLRNNLGLSTCVPHVLLPCDSEEDSLFLFASGNLRDYTQDEH
jgi:hypothetical protein